MAWIKYANIEKGLILSLPVSSIFTRNFSRKSTEKCMTVKEISKPRLLVTPCNWSSTLIDIKVTINSLSVFGFRYLVGGRVTTILKKTMSKFSPGLWSYVVHTCMSYKGMYTYHTCMHKTIHACIKEHVLCIYIIFMYVQCMLICKLGIHVN